MPGDDQLDVARVVVTGDPAAQIVATAVGLSADLIVIGRESGRVRGVFRPAELAGVLVGGAPCPVLAVQPERASLLAGR